MQFTVTKLHVLRGRNLADVHCRQIADDADLMAVWRCLRDMMLSIDSLPAAGASYTFKSSFVAVRCCVTLSVIILVFFVFLQVYTSKEGLWYVVWTQARIKIHLCCFTVGKRELRIRKLDLWSIAYCAHL